MQYRYSFHTDTSGWSTANTWNRRQCYNEEQTNNKYPYYNNFSDECIGNTTDVRIFLFGILEIHEVDSRFSTKVLTAG